MRLNKMTSYAIRAISCMASENDDTVTSKTIHEKEGIPHGVLMKVLRILRQEGVIVSHQGRGGLTGGFSLAEKAEGISVYCIIKAMEGGVELYPVGDEEAYRDSGSSLYEELKQANEAYVHQLDQIKIV